MFLLTPEDVEIISIQHPRKAKRVPILSYQEKTFRLVSVFNSGQGTEAQASIRDLTQNEGKACVLLEEPSRYTVWRQVRLDQGLMQPVAPQAYIQSCILLLQALYGDVEQLLGDKQAKRFGAALEADGNKQIRQLGGLGSLLRLNPLTEKLPRWEEDDLSVLLLILHRLGTKYFGRSKFAPRTLAALDILPSSDRTVFLNWLSLSLLGHLWLS